MLSVLLVPAIFLVGATDAVRPAKDVVCIAQTIYHEARGEPVEGQIAVANVVLNRTNHKQFPDSVCEVVYQKYQFSWTLNKKKREFDKPSLELAKKVYTGEIKDNTNGALYFHGKHISPTWNKNMIKVKSIGHHVFFKPKPKKAKTL